MAAVMGRAGWAEDMMRMASNVALRPRLRTRPEPLFEPVVGVGLFAEELAARSRERVLSNLDLADSFFGRHPAVFRLERPDAGSTAFPRFLDGSAEKFCERAAEQAGILLLPSTTYGTDDRHIRFGFGRRNLAEGLNALSEFLVRNDLG